MLQRRISNHMKLSYVTNPETDKEIHTQFEKNEIQDGSPIP